MIKLTQSYEIFPIGKHLLKKINSWIMFSAKRASEGLGQEAST